MKQYWRELSKRPVWLFVALLLMIVVADMVINNIWNAIYLGFMHGNGSLWWWGSYGITEAGLNSNAAFNPLWHELWFAEAIAFIIMPLLLWKYRKRHQAKILPWVLAGALALTGIFTTLTGYHPLPVTADDPYPANLNFTTVLHQGPTMPFYTVPFNRMFAGDPALESEFPDFLMSQMPYVFVLVIGYLISKGWRGTMKNVNNS